MGTSHDSLPHPFSSAPPAPSLLSRLSRLFSPSHRRRRSLTPDRGGLRDARSRSTRPRWPRKRTVAGLLLALVVLLWLPTRVWELQVELAVYRKEWVRSDLLDLTSPEVDLVGTCFPPAVGGKAYSAGAAGLQSTLALTHPGDCVAFASLLHAGPAERKPTTFHTYWRADLAPFGPRQALMIQSFLATQDLTSARLVLWTTGPLASPLLDSLLRDYPASVEVRIVDYGTLAAGTPLEGREDLLGPAMRDTQAWLDGDLVRLLALWNEGGVWVDMDMLLVRDLAPLYAGEWVEQWDCYSACPRTSCAAWPLALQLTPPRPRPADKPYQALNGALMHFHRHSPYLCSMLAVLAASPLPAKGTTAWGAHLYQRTLRRLLHAGVRPFEVLPWCLTDPRNCRVDKRVPDPFASDPSWFMGKKWAAGGIDELKVRSARSLTHLARRKEAAIADHPLNPPWSPLRTEHRRLPLAVGRLLAPPAQPVAEGLPARRLGPAPAGRADRAGARGAARDRLVRRCDHLVRRLRLVSRAKGRRRARGIH